MRILPIRAPTEWTMGFFTRKVVIAVVAVVTGMVLGVAVLIAARLLLPGVALPEAQRPEDSARYYPLNTLAYMWMTLTPGGEQEEHLHTFIERVQAHPGFQGFRGDLNEGLESDLVEDIMAWAGPDISIGVFGIAPGESGFGFSMEMALTTSVRDRTAAEKQVLTLVSNSQMFSVSPLEFDVENFYVWAGVGENEPSYALSDDTFVAASSSGALHKVLSRAAGLAENEGSLTLLPDFVAARSQYMPGRFASLFINSRVAYEQVFNGEFFSMSDSERSASRKAVEKAAPWTGASYEWKKKGIEGEWVTPYIENDLTASLTPERLPENYASLVPHDASVAVAWGYDPSLMNLRTGLAKFRMSELLGDSPGAFPDVMRSAPVMPGEFEDGTLADVLDLALSSAQLMLGVDLENDLLNHLSGYLIVAGTYAANGATQHDDELGIGVLVGHHEGSEVTVEQSLWDLFEQGASLVGSRDISFVPVGDDENAMVVNSDEVSVIVADGWISGASNLRWLGDLAATRRGQAPSLATRAEYLIAAEGLAPAKHLELFVDLGGLWQDNWQTGILSLGGLFDVLLVRDGGDEQFTRLTTVLTIAPADAESEQGDSATALDDESSDVQTEEGSDESKGLETETTPIEQEPVLE